MGSHGHSSIPEILAAATIIIFSFLCCSVKEDRDSCPGFLRMDLSNAFTKSDTTLTLVIIGESGFVHCDTLKASDFDSLERYVSVKVPRERLFIDVYSPFDAIRNPLEGYRPHGKVDSLNKYSRTLKAAWDVKTCEVRLHKDYCRLTVKMAGQGVNPCRLVFRSSVDGYLPGGFLSEGLYSETVFPGADGRCSLNLLRQRDESLMMDILPGDGRHEILRSFAVGEYLRESGYDWSKTDLEDIEMLIDYASANIVLRTDKWTRTVEFNLVI